MENTLKTLLQQTDAYNRTNEALLEAQHASRTETTLLRAEIETLTQKLKDYTGTPPPPSPAIPTSSPSAVEEMSLQLYGVQQGIEDILDVVRNPVGKRKRSPNSEYDNTKPQSPTTCRQLPQKRRDSSPTHAVIHSRHAATATQDALNVCTRQCTPCPTAEPLTITLSSTPTMNAEPDAPLPDETAAALEAEKAWKTATRKAMRWKTKAAEADNTRMETAREKTPTKQNGERVKKTDQPMTSNYHDAKIWVDVVRSGGINVQIVLGNGNLGQATLLRMTGLID
jgi:hypothetical protein